MRTAMEHYNAGLQAGELIKKLETRAARKGLQKGSREFNSYVFGTAARELRQSVQKAKTKDGKNNAHSARLD